MEDHYLEERVNISSSLILKSCIGVLENSKVNIVDFGCGDGRALKKMIEILNKNKIYIEKVFAVDIDPNIDLKNVEVIKFDLNNCNIPIQSDSIHIAYGLESIEHLTNPDIFIKEVYRIMKKDGIFAISTPNMLAWYNRIIFLLGGLPIHYEVSQNKKYGRLVGREGSTVGHIRVFSPRALKELLGDNGFRVTKMKGLRFIYGNGIGIIDSFFSHYLTLSSCFVCVSKKVTDEDLDIQKY